MNKHSGSTFDDFLKEQNLYDKVHAAVVKRVITELLEEGMAREGLSKPAMAKRMGTRRALSGRK